MQRLNHVACFFLAYDGVMILLQHSIDKYILYCLIYYAFSTSKDGISNKINCSV